MKKAIAFAAVILLSLSTAVLRSGDHQELVCTFDLDATLGSVVGGRSPLIVANPPLPFVPVTPCRVADTRGNGFTGQYGPPSLAAGAPRSFAIAGQCGISATAAAVSFNFTVVNTLGSGFLKVYPQGGVAPTVSTLNYVAGQVIANAAIAPLGSGGLTTVAGAAGFDLLIDVNGYYSATTTTGTFTIVNASGGGILGESTSAGIGVYGFSTGAGGWGVFGANDSATGYGVYGFNTGSGLGVFGSSNANGLEGKSTGTSGQLFGVIGSIASPDAGAAGVRGIDATGASTNGFDQYAESGVQGVVGCSINCYGVLGVAIGTSGYGGLFARQSAVSPFTVQTYSLFSGSATQAASFIGNVSVSGTLSKGGGSFKIDHPLDPENKYLYHSFVESPDMMNIYNGIVELNAFGEAIVELPDYFEKLNRDFRYQLTSIGMSQPGLYVADEVQNLTFRIAGGKPHARVSWQVTGIRQDAFANAHRIPVVEEKPKELRGTYMYPVELGVPAEKSEFFMRDGKPIVLGQRAPEEN